MANVVALLGLLLFWASLLWLPLAIVRAVHDRGGAQKWSIAAILTFGMAFMGFTRAMTPMGSAADAFAWSMSWAMPVGLAIFARSAPDASLRRADIWVGAGAALSFLPALPLMPGVLRGAAELIWGPLPPLP